MNAQRHLMTYIIVAMITTTGILVIEAFNQLHTSNGWYIWDNYIKIERFFLAVSKIRLLLVVDSLSCAFACLEEIKCFSLNIASVPNGEGLFNCQLLPTDKHNSSANLQNNSSFHHYSPLDPCSSHHCKNGATCVRVYDKSAAPYSCKCAPLFIGTTCEQTALTCRHIKTSLPAYPNGNYVIDPDGAGGVPSMTVYCDMVNKSGIGVTVISHDSEARTHVSGFNAPGQYSRDVTYTGASVAQLTALTNISSHCEQYIKYECQGAVFNHPYHGGLKYSWWLSRDWRKMMYWGGAPPGSGKCACGVTNTCDVNGTSCNCDANDRVWREDSGMLTEKNDLPVIQLRFGDTGASFEEGYHTLGKLKCY